MFLVLLWHQENSVVSLRSSPGVQRAVLAVKPFTLHTDALGNLTETLIAPHMMNFRFLIH